MVFVWEHFKLSVTIIPKLDSLIRPCFQGDYIDRSSVMRSLKREIERTKHANAALDLRMNREIASL